MLRIVHCIVLYNSKHDWHVNREIVKFDISKEWFHYLTNAKYE